MESWILGKRYIDCNLLDVRSIERAGVRKALLIQTTDGKVAIGGDISGEIAAGLGATLIDAQVPGRWNQHVGLKSVFAAQLIRGPRFIPGVLAVSTRSIVLFSYRTIGLSGRSTRSLGRSRRRFPCGFGGPRRARLEIHTHDQVVALILEAVNNDSNRWFMDFKKWIWSRHWVIDPWSTSRVQRWTAFFLVGTKSWFRLRAYWRSNGAFSGWTVVL